MRLYMRNKASGEIRDVEADSEEFRDLQAQVISNGQPMWEQTHFPHANEIKERAKFGELREEDLGLEHQEELRYRAVALASEGVGPEQNPFLELTPGEIESGLTRESKLEELRAMHNTEQTDSVHGVFEDAADKIADSREQRAERQEAGVQSALAGGSDDREDAPARGSTAGVKRSSGGSSGSGSSSARKSSGGTGTAGGSSAGATATTETSSSGSGE